MARVKKNIVTNKTRRIDMNTGEIRDTLTTTTNTVKKVGGNGMIIFIVIFSVIFIMIYSALHPNFIQYEHNDYGELEKVGLNISNDFSFADYLLIFDEDTSVNNFFGEWTTFEFDIPTLEEDASFWDALGNALLNIANVLLVPIRLIGFLVQSIVNVFLLVSKLFTWG